jgi:hypothetical protein
VHVEPLGAAIGSRKLSIRSATAIAAWLADPECSSPESGG